MTAPFESGGGWAGVLSSLSTGHDLSSSLAEAAMSEILAGTASSAQIAGFIVALRMKGETLEELSGLLDAMVDAAEVVTLTGGLDGVLDTCGTGGDRSHSINVSTLAAVVAVGAGARVCKHGNRAMSSLAGAADVLEALGVVIDLGPGAVLRCIEQAGMGFCFAPRFHPALRHAGPTRRELGVATVFNFLGPLANPARPRRQVVGVSNPAMAHKMLGVLEANGATHAMVVYGHDGLDELTTTGLSTVLDVRDGEVRERHLDPVDLGLPRATAEDLRGGDAQESAAIARAILGGEAGPRRDVVLLNAGAALEVTGAAGSIAEGMDLAAASIDSGSAAALLERWAGAGGNG